MSIQSIENGESALSVRTKLNSNFSGLEADKQPKIAPLAVADPSGVIAAEPKTFHCGSDGSLWYKKTGSGSSGWECLTGPMVLSGGAF